MADLDIPEDLLALKRDFLAADARCLEIADSLPSNVAVLELEANPEPERVAELVDARAERLEVLEQINRHPWWGQVESRYKASTALLEAAKKTMAAPAE